MRRLLILIFVTTSASAVAVAECEIQYGFAAADGRPYSARLKIDRGSTAEVARSGVTWIRNTGSTPVGFELAARTGVQKIRLQAGERDPRADRYRNPVTLARASCFSTPPAAAVTGLDIKPLSGGGPRSVFLIDGRRTLMGVTASGARQFNRAIPGSLCQGIPAPGVQGSTNRVSQGVSVPLAPYRWGVQVSARVQRAFNVALLRGNQILDQRAIQPSALAQQPQLVFETPRRQATAVVYRVGNDPGCWTLDAPQSPVADNDVAVRVDLANAIRERDETNNQIAYRPRS